MAKAKQSRKSGKDHRTPTIEPSTSNGNDRQALLNEPASVRRMTPDEQKELRQEMELLLKEIEMIYEKGRIAISLIRFNGGPYDPVEILELAVRLLQPRPHPTIREAAILAYAKTRLTELGE